MSQVRENPWRVADLISRYQWAWVFFFLHEKWAPSAELVRWFIEELRLQGWCDGGGVELEIGAEQYGLAMKQAIKMWDDAIKQVVSTLCKSQSLRSQYLQECFCVLKKCPPYYWESMLAGLRYFYRELKESKNLNSLCIHVLVTIIRSHEYQLYPQVKAFMDDLILTFPGTTFSQQLKYIIKNPDAMKNRSARVLTTQL